MSVERNTFGTLDAFLHLDLKFANNFNKNLKWKCSHRFVTLSATHAKKFLRILTNLKYIMIDIS
jgi:hypothetical protein